MVPLIKSDCNAAVDGISSPSSAESSRRSKSRFISKPSWLLLSISVNNFAPLADLPHTAERVEVFLAVDPARRTFKNRIQDPSQEKQEETPASSSCNMSAAKRSKSATKFALEDIDSLVPVKKGSSKSTIVPEPRAATTRTKSMAKRKKTSEPEGDSFDVERHLHEELTKGMVLVRSYYEKSLKELEGALGDMRTMAAAKDKTLSKLTKEKGSLEQQLLDMETRIHEEIMEATDQAKIWAARSVFEARIKMAKEAGDPGFYLSSWDVAKWKRTLADLGDGEDEDPSVKAVEAGPSGAKDGGDAAGEGGVIVGDEGCDEKS